MQLESMVRLMESMPSDHPVDPILKEIVARCIEESSTLTDAAAMIGQGFASISERCDTVQSLVAAQLSRMWMERK